jgi:signal transduction histidine kinase/DNA-binding response OmpR family regulator
MVKVQLSPNEDSVKARTEKLFQMQLERVHVRTDKLFAGLMICQWLGAIIAAFLISPLAWHGTESETHIHVWAAIWLGGIITAFPVYLALKKPGMAYTRQVIAIGQILMSALLIHLTGGRIETHFHVFGSLAFLSFYRDWRVLLTASAVVAMDHALRGIYFPQSVYGVLQVEPWRWLEHTGWVLFIDTWLIISIRLSLEEMKKIAGRQAELESTNAQVESKIIERTSELEAEVAQRKQAMKEVESLKESLEERVMELALNNRKLSSLANELERARNQALQASQLKTRFLANMSHEIRTPLNAVISMSDYLLRTNLNREQKDVAEIVHKSADALLAIVSDVLDLARIEAGKTELEIVEIDLLELVEESAEIVANRARQKKLSLSTYIAPDVPQLVRGDQVRLRQVLLNLLSNAVKFTDQGEVVVKVVVDKSDKSDQGVCCIRFTVSDTGIGLSEQALQSLFQPFTQADTSISRRFGGSGLGLTICKQLVELMNGEINVERRERGATFSFCVPLACSAKTKQLLGAGSELADLRVLIIGGPTGAGETLAAYVTSWGMRSLPVADITKALAVMRKASAENDPFDVLITELTAEGTDLLAFCESMRKFPEFAKIKLIVCTADDKYGQGENLLTQGVDAYLIKPFRQSRLFDCIAMLVGKHLVSTDFVPPMIESVTSRKAILPDAQPRILIVEDNVVNQQVALILLKELGYEASIVDSGKQAIEAVIHNNYALILMDCQMPDMDGFEATRQIRRLEPMTGRRIPIIALTAQALQGDREQCLAAGMDDYLSKPITSLRLKAIIQRWLSQPIESSAHDSAVAAKNGNGVAHSATSPIDFSALKEMYSEDGAVKLIELFLSSAYTLIDQMEQAMAKQDANEVKSIAHELKGSTVSLGIDKMATLSLDLENAARIEDWSKAHDVYKQLSDEFKRVSAYGSTVLG